MKAVITVKMDNAAFEAGREGVELARILRDLADRIEDGNFRDASDQDARLKDINGNHVGDLKVSQ